MERALRRYLPGGGFKNVTLERSLAMSAVRGRGNRTTEVRFRYALVRAGVRGWRMHPEEIPGSPDFLFNDARVVVFLDGCFWHGCKKCGHFPRANAAFWRAKIKRNQQRDSRTTAELRKSTFLVLRFWEHELGDGLDKCLRRLCDVLRTRRKSMRGFSTENCRLMIVD
jgi:DNA mismatch endonuclease (patch repair protein)